MPYIPAQYHNHLIEFKYKGGTDSYTYQYLWSPIDQYLVQYFPTWVAPNTITLSALLILSLQHLIFMLPDAPGGVPHWKLYMMAGCILIYQHLDNIDGKQARRTSTYVEQIENASPLGMLFDHGSDSLTTFLLAAQVAKITAISPNIAFLSYYSIIMPGAFCAMWIQYSIGHFSLGKINPVDEGLPLYAVGCVALTFLDQAIFTLRVYGLTYSEWIMMSMFVWMIITFYFTFKPIPTQRILPIKQILQPLCLYPIPGLLYMLVLYKNPLFFSQEYHFILYTTMLMWSHNSIFIQVCHITKQTFTIFNKATITFIVFMLLYLLTGSMGCIWGWSFVVVQGLVYGEFVVRVLLEGSEILNISLFTVGKAKSS